MATTVHANFGGEIMLLGYDFPDRRVKAGGALPITLYWQAQQDVQHHYIVFNHLLGADLGQWGGRDRIPRDYYSTALWTAGEVVRDDYLVPVDRSAPPGIYRLDVGLYEQIAGQPRSVSLVADGKPLDANSVTVASIKVGGPPPGVTVSEPMPQHIRRDQLGGVITLVGYDLGLEPGMLNLTLYWRCDARPSGDYTTFVHVRRAGSVIAQMDRPPANGAYPTSLWDPGDVIRDSVQVPLTPEVPAGEYEIAVGLYDFSTGARLPVVGPAPVSPEDGAISLTTVTIRE
jgi:hypothetical protein